MTTPNFLTPGLQDYVTSQLSDARVEIRQKDQLLRELQSQLEALKVERMESTSSTPQDTGASDRPSKKPDKPAVSPSQPSSSANPSTSKPSSRHSPVRATPKGKSRPVLPKAKRHPCQVMDEDTPANFKPVRVRMNPFLSIHGL